MTTTKTKNEQPRGYFKYILALDCETAGVALGCDDPSYNPNTGEIFPSVSWGFIVVDGHTLKEVESLYVEINPAKDYTWDAGTEKVHGLTREYLKKNGLSEEDAVMQIANLIIKYWGPDSYITLLGHNVMFDKAFLQRLMRRQGIELSFSNRMIDTFPLGYVLFEKFNSDDLFDILGFKARAEHNALEDIRLTVNTVRTIQSLFHEAVLGE